MVGMSLLVPVGPDIVRCNITPKTTTLRLSLRTAVPAEVKVRQAEVAAYFETLWASMRSSKPIALTHQVGFYRMLLQAHPRARHTTSGSDEVSPRTSTGGRLRVGYGLVGLHRRQAANEADRRAA